MGLEQKGMKEMIRRLDKLGRICIPKEFRKTYNWNDLQEVEIIEKDGKIILKKFKGKHCGNCNNLIANNDKFCSNCGNKIR